MDTDAQKKKTLVDSVWDFFASVRLAIIIFAMIALTSIVGTILEQQAEPERNVEVLIKMFGLSHDSAHSVLQVLDSLGFTNMYHSWWFVAFLLIFAANLIICSIDRLPRIMKLVREKIRPLPVEQIEKMSIRKTVALKGKPDEIRSRVFEGLRKIGFKPFEASRETGVQLFAEKGNATRLGVYITHLSILVILAGALIGVFFGYNAVLNLPEGAVSDVAYQAGGKTIPLGFEIRCDNFEVDFYERSDMPKAYQSWLTVMKNGQVVTQKRIVVNDPLSYDGVTFYQSSYGMLEQKMGNGIIILKAIGRDGAPQQMNLRIGDTFTIPGSDVQGKILDFSQALAIDGTGNAYTYGEMMTNPAVYIEFAEKGERKFGGWLLKRYPQTWNLPDGNRVEFVDYWGVEYTGMQVRKDPGVWIVYLGCVLMGIGLYMAFFMSHKRIWVALADGKGGVTATIGASANRNRAVFERKVEKLAAFLETDHKGGK